MVSRRNRPQNDVSRTVVEENDPKGKGDHYSWNFSKFLQEERKKLEAQQGPAARKEQAKLFKNDENSIIATIAKLKDYGVAAISRQQYSPDPRYGDYKPDPAQVAQNDDRTQLRIHAITHQILDAFRQAGKYHLVDTEEFHAAFNYASIGKHTEAIKELEKLEQRFNERDQKEEDAKTRAHGLLDHKTAQITFGDVWLKFREIDSIKIGDGQTTLAFRPDITSIKIVGSKAPLENEFKQLQTKRLLKETINTSLGKVTVEIPDNTFVEFKGPDGKTTHHDGRKKGSVTIENTHTRDNQNINQVHYELVDTMLGVGLINPPDSTKPSTSEYYEYGIQDNITGLVKKAKAKKSVDTKKYTTTSTEGDTVYTEVKTTTEEITKDRGNGRFDTIKDVTRTQTDYTRINEGNKITNKLRVKQDQHIRQTKDYKGDTVRNLEDSRIIHMNAEGQQVKEIYEFPMEIAKSIIVDTDRNEKMPVESMVRIQMKTLPDSPIVYHDQYKANPDEWTRQMYGFNFEAGVINCPNGKTFSINSAVWPRPDFTESKSSDNFPGAGATLQIAGPTKNELLNLSDYGDDNLLGKESRATEEGLKAERRKFTANLLNYLKQNITLSRCTEKPNLITEAFRHASICDNEINTHMGIYKNLFQTPPKDRYDWPEFIDGAKKLSDGHRLVNDGNEQMTKMVVAAQTLHEKMTQPGETGQIEDMEFQKQFETYDTYNREFSLTSKNALKNALSFINRGKKIIDDLSNDDKKAFKEIIDGLSESGKKIFDFREGGKKIFDPSDPVTNKEIEEISEQLKAKFTTLYKQELQCIRTKTGDDVKAFEAIKKNPRLQKLGTAKEFFSAEDFSKKMQTYAEDVANLTKLISKIKEIETEIDPPKKIENDTDSPSKLYARNRLNLKRAKAAADHNQFQAPTKQEIEAIAMKEAPSDNEAWLFLRSKIEGNGEVKSAGSHIACLKQPTLSSIDGVNGVDRARALLEYYSVETVDKANREARGNYALIKSVLEKEAYIHQYITTGDDKKGDLDETFLLTPSIPSQTTDLLAGAQSQQGDNYHFDPAIARHKSPEELSLAAQDKAAADLKKALITVEELITKEIKDPVLQEQLKRDAKGLVKIYTDNARDYRKQEREIQSWWQKLPEMRKLQRWQFWMSILSAAFNNTTNGTNIMNDSLGKANTKLVSSIVG